jgi:hypothetical protein
MRVIVRLAPRGGRHRRARLQRRAAGHKPDFHPTDRRAPQKYHGAGHRRIKQRGQNREEPGKRRVPAGALGEKIPTGVDKSSGNN